MAAPILTHRYTPEEYLERERAAEAKSEYLDGAIIAMAGASRAHSLINTNLASLLNAALRDQPCEVHASDMRVRVAAGRLYTYPDIAVVCGEAQTEDAHGDTLLNPTVIFEVLSPTTEAYDRGAKFGYYRQLPSLREYVLVAQDQLLVEPYARHADGWLLTEARDASDTLALPALVCALPLAEIYRKVGFSTDSGISSAEPGGPAGG
jgi:Uma2 family endonuclease